MRECPSDEELKQLANGMIPDSCAGELEQHLLDCEPCAESTLNFAKDDTLIASMRRVGSESKPVVVENPGIVATTSQDSASLRTIRLIEKLHDLPSTVPIDKSGATVLTLNHEADEKPCADWSRCFAPPESADELGRLNGFRVLKLLGQGGMGGVFLAEDMHLHRQIALKVMQPEVANRPGAPERFMREARAAAAVRCENIVTIYQVGQDRGVPFLAQELLHGESLDQRLKRDNHLPVIEAISIARQIAMGLAAAHDRGLIHRDVKPANVFLTTASTVKLLDFGLARTLDDSDQLTQSGMILGTPSYMAPEQGNGDPVDARVDLFSLGVVLYRMTTGKMPFPGTKMIEILTSLATVLPVPPLSLNPNMPRELSDFIETLMAKDRNNRPAKAADAARQLTIIEEQFVQRSLKTVAGKAFRFNRGRSVMVGFALFFILFLSAIWVIVKNNKGEVVATVKVPEDGSATVGPLATADSGANNQSAVPDQFSKKFDARGIGKPTPGNAHVVDSKGPKFITLDALDPKAIPESEHFAWQPNELVAVVGTHRLRDWNQIQSVSFHPSGAFFFSGSVRETSYLWSTKTLERLMWKGDPGFPQGMTRNCCRFTPDGKFLCTTHGKYEVDLSDPEHPKFRLLCELSSLKMGDYHQMVISPDSRWLAMTGPPRGTVQIWDISNDEPRFAKEAQFLIRGRTDMTSARDGRRLALTSEDSEGILVLDVDWNSPDGPQLVPFGEPHSGSCPALSPDGKKLVIRSPDGTKSQILDLTVTPPRVEFEFEGNNRFEFSPDGQQLVMNGAGAPILQKTAGGWEVRKGVYTTDGMNCKFWLAPDGKTLVVAEYYFGVMRVWDLSTNPPVERLPTRHYRAAAFSPDGRLLAVTGGDADSVFKLDGAVPELLSELRLVGGGNFLPPSFSPDSLLVAYPHHVETQVWNLGLPKPQMISDSGIYFARFANHGTAVESTDGGQWVSTPWELTKRGRFRLGAEKAVIRSEKIAAERYVKQQDPSKLTVWSVNDDAKPIFEMRHPDLIQIEDYCLSDNGDLLAAFTPSGKNVVWDLTETPPREYVLPGRTTHNVNSFFAEDGKLLVVAHENGIDIHDWIAERLVRQFRFGDIRGLARHPDGQHLATINSNGTIYVLRLNEFVAHAKK